MNKLTKIGAMSLAALALGLSGAAQAAETRSGSAIPAMAKKAPKRTVPFAGAKRSKIDGEDAVIIGGGIATVTVAAIALGDGSGDGNSNGSGG